MHLADYLLKFDYKEFTQLEPYEEIAVLNIEEILLIPTEHHTGKEFDHLIIAWLQTNKGNYEVLFNKQKNRLPFGDEKELVEKLEKCFNKVFKPLMFDNQLYYCNTF